MCKKSRVYYHMGRERTDMRQADKNDRIKVKMARPSIMNGAQLMRLSPTKIPMAVSNIGPHIKIISTSQTRVFESIMSVTGSLIERVT